jgi:hypothetical protein
MDMYISIAAIYMFSYSLMTPSPDFGLPASDFGLLSSSEALAQEGDFINSLHSTILSEFCNQQQLSSD